MQSNKSNFFKIGITIALLLLTSYANIALIIRFGKNGNETDIYFILSAAIIFVSAITNTYINTKWITRLRKVYQRQKKYLVRKRLYDNDAIFATFMGFIIAFIAIGGAYMFTDQIADNYLSILLMTCFIAGAATFLNAISVEMRINGKVNQAEYPQLMVQILLFFTLIILEPETVFKVFTSLFFVNLFVCLFYCHVKKFFKSNLFSSFSLRKFSKSIILFLKVGLNASIFKSSPLIDRLLASTLITGDVTCLAIASVVTNGIATFTEKTIGFKNVLITVDCLKASKKPQIWKKLTLIAILVISLILFMYSIERTTNLITETLQWIFNISKTNSITVLNILLILLLISPIQIMGPSVSAIYQYNGNELFPMYVGSGGFIIGFLLKYGFIAYFGILTIPIISLFVVATLFFINLYFSEKND